MSGPALVATVAGVVLVIEAEPASRWAVSCEVQHRDGRELVEFSGAGTATRELPAAAVDCAVTLVAGDRLSVAMVDARGNRSQSRVTGAGSLVSLRSR